MSAPPSTLKADQPPATPPRARPKRPARARRSAERPRLAQTAGPDPQTPLAEVRLAIGTLGAPHGLDGALRLHLTSDDPEHVQTITRAYLDGEQRARRVTEIRLRGGEALIRFHGVSSPEAARTLTGRVVRIAGSDARPPAPGEFFLYQLIGLKVFDEAGVELGEVTDLLETGANDVLVITPVGGGADLLLPHVPEVILDIVPGEGRMVARPPLYYGEAPK